MKRTLKLALSVGLGAMMIVPSFAQDNFPDTPANHWAWESLANLKREGILVGYPDGLFRGPRTATRYELAVALNATYQKLMGMINGLSDQVKSLQDALGTGNGGDMKGLKEQLAALQGDVEKMKGWGDEVASLKKMATTFEKELASMGVDVEGMKKDLAGLEERVSKLEKTRGAVDISGDGNLWVAAGNSRDGSFGQTKDGRIVGTQNGGPAGLTRDYNVYHELAVTLKGTNTTGPKWWGTVVYGNMLNAFGDQSTRIGGTYGNGSGDLYIQDFGVAFDTSLAGLGFSAKIGRLGEQIGSYILQRRDNSPYFDNARWDDGNYRFDGASLGFNFGKVGLKVFGGRNTNIQSNGGTELNPINTGFADPNNANGGLAGFAVDSTLAAVVTFPLGTIGDLKGAYVFHDSDGNIAAGAANRLTVLGGEGNFKFGKVALNGGWSKSLLNHNKNGLGLDRNNKAAYVNAAANFGALDIDVEYRKVQHAFQAAGSWRRIGTNWSPTNIKTFYGHVGYQATPKLGLHYMGEFGQTIAAQGGRPADTDIMSNQAKLDYKVNSDWTAMLGYEDVQLKKGGTTYNRQKWASVGFGYNMGASSMLKLAYEYGSVNNTVAWGTGAAGVYRGGFLTTQLSFKF